MPGKKKYNQLLFNSFRDMKPIELADIGAGGSKMELWEPLRSKINLHLFEPNQERFDELIKDQECSVYQTAIYDSKCQKTLKVAAHGDLTSLLPPNMKLLSKFSVAAEHEVIREEAIKCDTIDNIMSDDSNLNLDFLKIDVQGCNYEALVGAKRQLGKSVLGVHTELEFIERYEGQALFGDIFNYLNDLGYDVFDIQRWFWKRKVDPHSGGPKGQIVFGNALFLRGIVSFKNLISELSAEEQKIAIEKYICISLVYGYVDFAAEILEEFKAHIEIEAHIRLTNAIASLSQRTILPKFKGRDRVEVTLRAFLKLFCRDSYFYGDRSLGNRF